MMMMTATVAVVARTMRVAMMEMRMTKRRTRRRTRKRRKSSKVQLPVAVAGLGDQVVVVP